jgi:hypothetical protein
MITVKCTYTNGDTTMTGINTTLDVATKYFLNKWFNLGSGREETEDNMQKCIKIEEV